MLGRLAQSSKKNLITIIHFDVETRAYGEEEFSANDLLDGCLSLISIGSSGGIYSRGSDQLLVFMASSSSFSRKIGLPILYICLVPASSNLQHLHLEGTESISVILRERRALRRLDQPWSLILACPLEIPCCRNRRDGESTPRLDRDCLPLLECLGIGGVVTQLVEDLLDCLATVGYVLQRPSLKRFDVERTDVNRCAEAFIKTHDHKLVVLKADLSMGENYLLHVTQCLLFQGRIGQNGIGSCLAPMEGYLKSQLTMIGCWCPRRPPLSALSRSVVPARPNAIRAVRE
ncbi:hypothetical protein BKA70DRAFT_1575545, partial [Coprinopsis sp. MPI-PUGE-AT-0042]